MKREKLRKSTRCPIAFYYLALPKMTLSLRLWQLVAAFHGLVATFSIVAAPDARLPQIITWSAPTNKAVLFVGSPFALSAASSSGLPVTFSIVNGPASIVGAQLIPTAAGSVVIKAEQPGNEQFQPVTAERSTIVIRVPQTLTWAEPANNATLILGQTYPLAASASSGLPVAFRVASGPGVIVGDAMTVTGVGTILLEAAQAGNDTYAPATAPRTVNQGSLAIQRVGEWPGFPRGNPAGFFVEGSRAYLANGLGGVAIDDITDPSHPTLLGRLDTSGYASSIQVVGSIAYVADGIGGLLVMDVSDPATPKLLGSYSFPYALSLHVIGSTAYVAASTRGLMIFDVSDPRNPRLSGQFNTDIFSLSARALSVRVVGTLAYLATGDSGLQIVDVSQPEHPVLKGRLDTAGDANWVEIVGSTAYVADGSAGLQIIDVSNPALPTRIGGFSNGGFARSVQVLDGIAYIAAPSALLVVDVRVPENPVRLSSFEAPGEALAVQVLGGIAYFSSTTGLHILDVSHPQAISLISRIDSGGSANSIHVVGDRAYVADDFAGAHVIDISNTQNPTRIGGYRDGNSALSLYAVGSIVYVVNYFAGLRAWDLGDPTNPLRLGLYSGTPGVAASSVYVTEGIAYLANGRSGLTIIDASNPARLAHLSSQFTTGNAAGGRSVQVSGGVAYLADGVAGLELIDVRDPMKPLLLSRFASRGATLGVQVVGNLAYAAQANAGLEIIDVSNPYNPSSLGILETGGVANSVWVDGTLAYVAAGPGGLHVVDVSNPRSPTLAGGFPTRGYTAAVQVSGDLAYTAEREWGIQILKLRDRKLSQTIAWSMPQSVQADPVPIPLNATASSGLPVTFSVVNGPASISGNQLTFTGSADVTVRAEQTGNVQFLSATAEKVITVMPAKHRVVGELRYYAGASKIPGTPLFIDSSTSSPYLTDSEGAFSLLLNRGVDHSVAPAYPEELTVTQGVTTLDISLVRRHVLGLGPLDSGYKMLAADVNGSGSITTLDITHMRRLILGLTNNVPAGLWMFVPSSHVFSSPSFPFEPDPTRRYPALNADQVNQDFVGIKRGDVNGSWTPTSVSAQSLGRNVAPLPSTPQASGTNPRRIGLHLAGSRAELSGIVEVPIMASGFDGATSLQFSLSWNPSILRYEAVEGVTFADLGEGNVNAAKADEGHLSASWDDVGGNGIRLPDTAILMKLKFRTIAQAAALAAVQFAYSPTPLEASVRFASVSIDLENAMVWVGTDPENIRLAEPQMVPTPQGQKLTLQIGTALGCDYLIERCESLGSPVWTLLRRIAGDGMPQRHEEYLDANSTMRFYRVRLSPAEP